MSKLLEFRRLLNGIHQQDCLVGNITMGEIADALDKQAAEIERLRPVVEAAKGVFEAVRRVTRYGVQHPSYECPEHEMAALLRSIQAYRRAAERERER